MSQERGRSRASIGAGRGATSGKKTPAETNLGLGQGRLDKKKLGKLRIGIVVSTFNEEIARLLLDGCQSYMEKVGIPAGRVRRVPGALEIPFMVKKLALERDKKGRAAYDGFVALGCVVRGQTYHFEVVSDVSAIGLQSVQLESMIPVANGILTVDTIAQARSRAADKPRHCIDALLSLLA